MKKARSPDKKSARGSTSPGEGPSGAADRRGRKTLGYAQDAGHPGGLQDLRAKTDTETEHDAWGRHG